MRAMQVIQVRLKKKVLMGQIDYPKSYPKNE